VQISWEVTFVSIVKCYVGNIIELFPTRNVLSEGLDWTDLFKRLTALQLTPRVVLMVVRHHIDVSDTDINDG